MRRLAITTLALLGLASSLAACAPRFDGFDCVMLNDTPSGAVCSDQEIRVSRGEALVVRLSARSESRTDYDGDTEIELRTTDGQAVSVLPGVGRDLTIIGLTEGTTMLEVWVDGQIEDEVPATVLASVPSMGRD